MSALEYSEPEAAGLLSAKTRCRIVCQAMTGLTASVTAASRKCRFERRSRHAGPVRRCSFWVHVLVFLNKRLEPSRDAQAQVENQASAYVTTERLAEGGCATPGNG